uniref:putative F-box protein At5g62660 n=1 Tax=Fragaria vesca subsp. vesca TaxID=101020 RepID=UPI0005CA877A|nr:PREDICTED: putative F-box protein At5g62660 [Fragaria vesca subsp. vesca]
MEKVQQNFDLPEDIILQILCRLPFKSLIRFSCVSKQWRGIILSDPQFGNAHLKLASEQRTITKRLFLTIFPYELDLLDEIPELGVPHQFKFLERSFGDDSLVRNLTIPPEECGKVLSSNGLVALGYFHKGWSIWNPSTGFCRKIRAPDYSLVMKKYKAPLREGEAQQSEHCV